MVLLLASLLLIASTGPSWNRARAKSVGSLAQELAGEMERARQRAVSFQMPTAVVLPSAGAGRGTRSFYVLQGEVQPRISRVKTWGDDIYEGVAIIPGHWSLSGPGGGYQSGGPLPNLASSNFDFAGWQAPHPNHAHFVFLPGGEVFSNLELHFDDAYHIPVCAGYEGRVAALGGVTSWELTRTGPAATVVVSRLGAVRVDPGLTRGRAIQQPDRLAVPGALVDPPALPAPTNQAPRIQTVEVLPPPHPATRSPGIDATVDLGGHLTVRLEVAEPDGDPLQARLLSRHISGGGGDPGVSSSPETLRLEWNGSAWVGRTQWQVPADAQVGAIYRLRVEVEDPDGLTDSSTFGAQGEVEVIARGKILFTHQGRLSLMNTDGTEIFPLLEVPINTQQAKLSPDRTRIAFAGQGGGYPWGIYVTDLEGTELRRLTPVMAPQFEYYSPQWNADGSRIYAYREETPNVNAALFELDPSGVAPPRIFNSGPWPGDYSGPLIDTTTMVSVHSGGIYTIDTVTGARGTDLYPSVGWTGSPKFSPDETFAIYMHGPTYSMDGNTDLILSPYNSTTRTLGAGINLTSGHGGMDGFYEWGSWSPDGRQIVFESNRNGPVRIFRADIDTATGTLSNVVELAEGRHPTWVQADR